MTNGSTQNDPNGNHDKTVMRSLGEFFGHIWSGMKHDPTAKKTKVIEKKVHEEKRGKTTLRETVIREIEVDDEPPESDK